MAQHFTIESVDNYQLILAADEIHKPDYFLWRVSVMYPFQGQEGVTISPQNDSELRVVMVLAPNEKDAISMALCHLELSNYQCDIPAHRIQAVVAKLPLVIQGWGKSTVY